MSTTQPLDQRILAELTRAADTLAGLARRLGVDATTVLRTLQQLGSLKRVNCRREDGQLLWDVEVGADLPPSPPAPAAVPAVARRLAASAPATPAPAPARPQPVASVTTVRPAQPRRTRRASGVTDRLRAALRAKPWQSAGDLLAALPDANRDAIYALLSQRVRAGEFIAHPATGRDRRYAHAGTPLPVGDAVAPFKPRRHAPGLHPTVAGMATGFEQCLRFIAWAQSLEGDPTAEQIQRQFNVSRATAYRWLGAWQAAREALAA